MTTTAAPFYSEVWFLVVVCVAAVLLLFVVILVLVKCCCRRQPGYQRQRVPLDQSAKTSPPSYHYQHDDPFRHTLYNKRRVRGYLLRLSVTALCIYAKTIKLYRRVYLFSRTHLRVRQGSRSVASMSMELKQKRPASQRTQCDVYGYVFIISSFS